MIGQTYADRYTVARLTAVSECSGCGRGLQAQALCWHDDHHPDHYLCGRCVNVDPKFLSAYRTAVQAPREDTDQVPGQLGIELP